MVTLSSQNEIVLRTELRVLKIEPREWSFFASFGLSLLSSIKSSDSAASTKSFQILYAYLPSLEAFLLQRNLLNYYQSFKLVFDNIKSYDSAISLASTDNQWLYIVFYNFWGLYCIFLQDNSPDIQKISAKSHLAQLEYLCKGLEVNLIMYTNDFIHNLGAGLQLSLYESDPGQFSIITEQKKVIEQSKDQYLLDSLFSCINLPIYISEMQALKDWIENYTGQGGTLTPNMQKMLATLESWKCGHDRKEIVLKCGQIHCAYCVFNNIKDSVLDNALCLCGQHITKKDFEAVFAMTEPKFNVKYACEQCKAVFGINESLVCIGHYTCNKCRLFDLDKCVRCHRLYSDIDIETLKNYAKNDESIEKNCHYCKKFMEIDEKRCPSCRGLCYSCFNNLDKCSKCKNPTGIEDKIVIICTFCDQKIGKENVAVFPCKHPYHKKTCVKKFCKLCQPKK
jgi:hypothetical protein